MSSAFCFRNNFNWYAVQPTPELLTWIESNATLSDQMWQTVARGTPGALTDLTFPMFVRDLKRIKVNRLVYPSGGVMDWGYCYMLLTTTDVNAIKSGGWSWQGIIVLDDGLGSGGVAMQNFSLLASVPLAEVGSAYDPSGGTGRTMTVMDVSESLHLCLFVDERYFVANYGFWGAQQPLPYPPPLDSWSSLINALVADGPIGITNLASFLSTLDSSYGKPSDYSDFAEVCQGHAGMMLQAALVNIGAVVARATTGLYTIYKMSDAFGFEKSITLVGYSMRSGGDWWNDPNGYYTTNILPTNVICQYPLFSITQTGDTVQSGTWWGQDQDPGANHLRSPLNCTRYYNSQVSASGVLTGWPSYPPSGSVLFNGYAKQYRCCAAALVTTANPTSPSNSSQLDNLTTLIARNYYYRRMASLKNEVWNGMVPPSMYGLWTYIYDFNTDCCTHIIGGDANAVEYDQMMHDYGKCAFISATAATGGGCIGGKFGISGSGSGTTIATSYINFTTYQSVASAISLASTNQVGLYQVGDYWIDAQCVIYDGDITSNSSRQTLDLQVFKNGAASGNVMADRHSWFPLNGMPEKLHVCGLVNVTSADVTASGYAAITLQVRTTTGDGYAPTMLIVSGNTEYNAASGYSRYRMNMLNITYPYQTSTASTD